LDEGMSEAEALGSVIHELDLDDMRQTLAEEAKAQAEAARPQAEQRAEWRQEGDMGRQAVGHDSGHGWQGAAPMYGMPRASDEEKREMASAFRRYQPRFAVGIGLGVVFAIAGVVLAALAGIYFDNPAYTVIAFFAPIAIAVFLFIVLGIRYSTYMSFFRANRMYEYLSADEADRMLRQEYRYRMNPGQNAYRKERNREAASSVLWLVAVIAFLLLGFLGNLWHPGWIVFLVAAAIQTLISLI
ncbi:MAG: hypothetical protein PHV73_06065, partial [Eubacteriales bacterium]|nr:hypothetical protein [Eubacteriales bacterium]